MALDQPGGIQGRSMSAKVTDIHPRVRGKSLRRSLYYITFGWFFGAFWMFSTTGATVTELARYLGANDLTFGYLAAAGFLGSIFQSIGSIYTESTGRFKPVFLWPGTIQRLLYILMAILPWIFPTGDGAWALVGLVLLASALGNIANAPWVLWMSHLVPTRAAGKYFSQKNRLGIIVSVFTAILIGVVLDSVRNGPVIHQLGAIQDHFHMPPLIFMISLIFFVAAIAGTIEIQCYHGVAEPSIEARPASVMHSFIAPLSDRPFMIYVLYSCVYTFAVTFSGTFVWVMVLKLMGASHGHSWFFLHPFLTTCLMIMVATNIGQIASYPIWGRLIDRLGCKPVILIASSLHTMTWMAFVFLSSTTLSLGFVGCFFGGVFASALEIANFNMMLSFARRGGSGYQAIAAIFVNSAGLCAGLAAGAFTYWIDGKPHATFLGHSFSRYNLLFLLAAAIKCMGDYLILPWVQDAPAKPIRFAIRYIAGNAFEMLNSQFFAPLRSSVINRGFRPWHWFK